MASISRRPNGTWQARYRATPGGPQRSRVFARKVDAQRWLDEVRASIVTGQYVDPAAGRQTVREYAEQWRAAQVHRPTTAAHVETMLRRHVYPSLGDKQLSAVLPSDVQALVKRLSKTLAPGTVGVIHRILSAVFKAAVRDRRIIASPCTGTRLPKVHKQRIEPLSVEAVRAMTDAVPERYRALITLAAGTGLRQGEALGLTVDRIDFLRRQLTVDRQLVTMPDRPPYLAPPKTQASVRVVPLPQVVVDALAAHLARWPSDGFVFTTDLGNPIRRTAFSATVWRPAVRAAGLDDTVTFHGLRHFYASLLIRHGESIKTVQARLGHASAAETLDTYSHLWPDSDDRTRAAVDAVLAPAAEEHLRNGDPRRT
ncbi:tyrosine-type recombinase/integrase [Geodermatophilus nigrescens]